MGHDSEKTTQIYLDSFGSNILDEASKVILPMPFKEKLKKTNRL